jgi:hypothetical protein
MPSTNANHFQPATLELGIGYIQIPSVNLLLWNIDLFKVDLNSVPLHPRHRYSPPTSRQVLSLFGPTWQHRQVNVFHPDPSLNNLSSEDTPQ